MNYSSDAEFKNFVKIYKKCTSKPYSFLANDISLASDNLFPLALDNLSRFRRSLVKKFKKLLCHLIKESKIKNY